MRKRLVLSVQDPDPDDLRPPTGGHVASTRPRVPIVVDRYHFKQDGAGIPRQPSDAPLPVRRRVEESSTSSRPAVSTKPIRPGRPTARSIAFVSARGPDPDKANDSNIYVVEARVGAQPRQLTKFDGPDGGRPAWSPDGKQIAYLQGSEPKLYAYSLDKLAIVPVEGGDRAHRHGGARPGRGFTRVDEGRQHDHGRWCRTIAPVHLARVRVVGRQRDAGDRGPAHRVVVSRPVADGRIAVLAGDRHAA